ncbi:MAG: hypothetical protein IPH82_18355 [Chloroflexi bacterium]|nr:hypothetical protein [Chloroflexota bacterium]
MGNSKQEAETLNSYIDGRFPADATPDPAARRVIDSLQSQVEQISPDPRFVNQLSARLQTAANQRTAPPTGLDWLVIRLVPRLLWVGAATAVLALLLWGLPQILRQQTAVEPAVEQLAISQTAAGAPNSQAFNLPDSPAQLPIYQLILEPPPDTDQAALAWAIEFGLMDPQLFTDLSQPTPTARLVLGSDGQQLVFPWTSGSAIHYTRQPFQPALGVSLPFDEAADIAIAFLTAHGLRPAEGAVISENNGQGPIPPDAAVRLVQISPPTGGYPLATGGVVPGMLVAVGPDGAVRQAAFLPAAIAPSTESAAIIPAAEVYQAFVDGQTRPFHLSLVGGDTAATSLPFRQFTPPLPTHTSGEVVTVSGWVNALQSADGRITQITLYSGVDGAAYRLQGLRLDAFLADFRATPLVSSYHVQGTIRDALSGNLWALDLASWEAGQPLTSSYAPFSCQIGMFAWVDGEGWLTVEGDNGRYALPNAPTELQTGERIEVCAETYPADGQSLSWQSITQPPASEFPAAEPGLVLYDEDAALPTPPALSDLAAYPAHQPAYPAAASSYPAPPDPYPGLPEEPAPANAMPLVVQAVPLGSAGELAQVVIDRMELVYFYNPAVNQTAEQQLTPAWAIHGRIAASNESFTAYFYAVKE